MWIEFFDTHTQKKDDTPITEVDVVKMMKSISKIESKRKRDRERKGKREREKKEARKREQE